MVTTVQFSNTVAFPSPKNTSRTKRAPNADQQIALRLRLSNLLQTTLELPRVLQLFFDEVQLCLSISGLNYRHEKVNGSIDLGKNSNHSCHYKLITEKDGLGELSFTRGKRFSDKELQLLETLIGSLICPIRNALLYAEAIQTALKDPLTGAGNRLALETTLEREIGLAVRHKQPLSVLVVDIDKFKIVNDSFGHIAGDYVLKDVARQLAQCCRDTDATYRAYRFGGEEFVVLLNNTDNEGALIAAERVRSCIEQMTTTYEDRSIEVTVSVGISSLKPDDNMSSLFERADKALYAAKDKGRNQVVHS